MCGLNVGVLEIMDSNKQPSVGVIPAVMCWVFGLFHHRRIYLFIWFGLCCCDILFIHASGFQHLQEISCCKWQVVPHMEMKNRFDPKPAASPGKGSSGDLALCFKAGQLQNAANIMSPWWPQLCLFFYLHRPCTYCTHSWYVITATHDG